ncbi:MAG: hypothetical protein ACMZI0_18325 [Symbiopectobacterium sp.]|uniref:hypothetical protein n=1 Tax=Symbiopectobacterium sp. TaxID=2952789 RepID=UPI0039E81EE1
MTTLLHSPLNVENAIIAKRAINPAEFFSAKSNVLIKNISFVHHSAKNIITNKKTTIGISGYLT